MDKTTTLEIAKPMVGPFASIYRCSYTMYARYARACWGQNDRSPTRPSEHLFGGTSGPFEKDISLVCDNSLANSFLWDVGSTFSY
jgi:hypothetical protein